MVKKKKGFDILGESIVKGVEGALKGAYHGSNHGRAIGFASGAAMRSRQVVKVVSFATKGLQQSALLLEAAAVASRTGTELSGPGAVIGGGLGALAGGLGGVIAVCNKLDNGLESVETSLKNNDDGN